MRAQGRHKSAKVLPRYAKRTMKHVAEGARNRRAVLNDLCHGHPAILTSGPLLILTPFRSGSPINSGATKYKPQLRGRDTFLSVARYPFDQRRKTRSAQDSIAELVVRKGVPDIANHVIAAHRVHKKAWQEL
jgi:hypothetical protein